MKSFTGVVRRIVINALAKKLAVWLLSLLLPVLVLALLFFFVYSALFMIPRYIVGEVRAGGKSGEDRVTAIFTTGGRDDWKLADDQKLYKKYGELERAWLEKFIDQEALETSRVQYCAGNAAREDARVKDVWGRFYEKDSGIPAERTQVRQHTVSWALLAAVDRVLGDPVITGLPGRRPDPEGHFSALEPRIRWRDFDLYYHSSWTEHGGPGPAGGSTEKTVTYRHRIRLLEEVRSYEADRIAYRWEARRHQYSDRESGFTEEAVYPDLVGVTQHGPYFRGLRDLLGAGGLVRESNLELVLNLAMNYDDEFKYNTGLISGNMAELYSDTESGGYGLKGPPGAYQWPAGEYRTITSGYGWRTHPVLGGLRFHKGIDIALPRGSPVMSAWDGEVILAGWVSGYGKTVIIDHGRYRTLYAHLMSWEVDSGLGVKRGQVIGKADSTGLSTGDHLHFEIRSGIGETNYQDPLEVFNSLTRGGGSAF